MARSDGDTWDWQLRHCDPCSSAWQRTRHVVTCFAARARGRRLNAPNHWRCQPGHSWLVIDFSHFTEHGTANTREMRSDTNL